MLATIETSNLAIKKGFEVSNTHQYFADEDGTQPLILLAEIQEWLREKNIICEVNIYAWWLNNARKVMYGFNIHEVEGINVESLSTDDQVDLEFETYLEALEEAINIGLNYVDN